MPFNTLLLHGFIHDTSVEEKNVRVVAHQKDDEKILVFHLDTRDRLIRDTLKVPDGTGLCDYLFFYSKLDAKTKKYARTLCLVELKGEDIQHATDQIIDTYKHLYRTLKSDSCCPPLQNIFWKAYICYNANSPIKQKRPFEDKLHNTKYFKNIDITSDKGVDKQGYFDSFLRK